MVTLTLSKHYPVLGVEENRIFSGSGDVIKAYRVDLPEAYAPSEGDFENFHSIWYRAFKNFRPGTIILKQDVYLKKNYNPDGLPEGNFFQNQTRDHFQGRPWIDHYSLLFFIDAESHGFLKSPNIRIPFRKIPDTREFLSKQKINRQFLTEVDQSVEYLNGTRILHLTPLTGKQIHQFTRSYFNGFYADRTTDAEKGKGYTIGNRKTGAYVIKSIKQLPENISNSVVDQKASSDEFEFHRGFVDNLGLGLEFNHVYNQIFYMDDHQKLKNNLKKLQSHLFGAREFSKDNRNNSEQLDKYLDDMARDEKIRLVRTHFSVLFFGESEEEFKKNDNEISKQFREMDIMPYFPTGNNLANIYNNSFFCHVSNLNSANTFICDLQVASCLISNVSNYRADQEGVIFNDRLFNIPVKKDIWDAGKRRIKARNFFIIAPTGEGKSFLALHIFRQLLDQGYHVLINDLGGSYEKLSLLYKDVSLYLKYKQGEALGINPFYLSGEETPDAVKLNQLVEFNRTLWKRDKAIEEDEAVSLRKVLKYYYEKKSDGHSFPDFYRFVHHLHQDGLLNRALDIESQFFNVKEFLHNCSEFIDGGTYSFLFPEDQEKFNIDLEGKRLVIFELDEAKDDPLLISVLLSISADIDQRLIWKDKAKRGYIFYDEFAKQLKFPNVLTSVEYKFQAIRKQNAGIGIVIQTPTQLPENSTAASIIDNTQVFYVLHNQKGYDHIVERLKLSTHDHNQLSSITNNFSGKIKYSEFMLKIGAASNIMRLEVPEAVMSAYLTEGEENEKIMEFYKKTGDMERAIKEFVSKRNRA